MIHGILASMEPIVSDGEEDESDEVNFVFRENASGTAAAAARDCSVLIICGPGAASAYALSAFSLSKAPWTLDLENPGVRTFPPPPRTPRFFTIEGSGAAVALLDQAVPTEFSIAFAEALLPAFGRADNVIFLDRVFRAGWRMACGEAERPQEPHLCGLWTSAWGPAGPLGKEGALPRLPAPNAVEALQAAVLTRCQADGTCAMLALALQDGAHLGEGVVGAFEGLAPLLRRLGALPEGASAPDYRAAVRMVVPPASMSIYA
mmetsp:Transcript_34980/g.99507  ORF Transcript_34980/g.99507 Transcript_34980/m.99507 type:complete len:262 (+) Transcript_34980:111-896(+)